MAPTLVCLPASPSQPLLSMGAACSPASPSCHTSHPPLPPPQVWSAWHTTASIDHHTTPMWLHLLCLLHL